MSKRGKPYTGRDWNLVRILQGATKSGIHNDLKKQANRDACREWRDEWDNEASGSCGREQADGGGYCEDSGLRLQDIDPANDSEAPLLQPQVVIRRTVVGR